MLGDNIRKIRKTKHISINNLSKISGVSLGYLSDLENNKLKNPTLDMLKKIACSLDVKVNDLLTEKERVEISTSEIKDINELAKNALNKVNLINDQEGNIHEIVSGFNNEQFSKDEEKQIIDYIKYILHKRK